VKKVAVPYSLIEICRRFGGTYSRVNEQAKQKAGSKQHPDVGGSTFLRNAGKFLPDMLLHSRRQHASISE
jgi:hypothetical protein